MRVNLEPLKQCHPVVARILGEQRKPMPYLLDQTPMASFPQVMEVNRWLASERARKYAPEGAEVALLWWGGYDWFCFFQRNADREAHPSPGMLNFFPVYPPDDCQPKAVRPNGVAKPRLPGIGDFVGRFIADGKDVKDMTPEQMVEYLDYLHERETNPFHGAGVIDDKMMAAHAAKPVALTEEEELLAEELTHQITHHSGAINPIIEASRVSVPVVAPVDKPAGLVKIRRRRK